MTIRRLSFSSLTGIRPTGEGLTDEEVERQRALHGWNDIVEVPGHPAWELIRDTLRDPMIGFLVVIGVAFYAAGEIRDAVILLLAILPLVLMDAILHRRTQATTASLRGQLATRCRVLRAGAEREIPARELVPGDRVVLRPGEQLPADGILESAEGIQVDESALTGESLPIEKRAWARDPARWPNEGDHPVPVDAFASAGTRVLSGRGVLRVLFIGGATAYGEIVQSVAKLPHERTPLQKSISRLVSRLVWIATAFCLLLAGVRILQGHGWLDALLSAATLAVAAIPEEFPVVFTFFLGVGVYRLALHQALVRRSVSVENVGRVSAICTDKTGTITLGQLSLSQQVPVEPGGERALLAAALAASQPEAPDPVDLAIFEEVARRGLEEPQRIEVFPFTEDRKREAALVASDDGGRLAVLKGAPENVIELCALADADRARWIAEADHLAASGPKVLACASRRIDASDPAGEPEAGYSFLGLLCFADPPRPEVPGAIEYCRRQGIRVLMVTGDHPSTAAAVCRAVGIGGGGEPRVLNAAENEVRFSREWLAANPGSLDGVDAVARCRPMQKLAIVEALQAAGEVVAVTGDGVNDVPALKAADIGIAMGLRGTRSAREVSSIILADDNFSTIVRAIREGRQLYANLRRSFEYLLLFHIPFVLSAAIVPFAGFPILYLPAHIVVLELMLHPTALFAFQRRARREERRPDRGTGAVADFFTRGQLLRIVAGGGTCTLLLFELFVHQLGTEHAIERARTQAIVVLGLWSAAVAARLSRLGTRASQLVVGFSLGGLALVVAIPGLRSALHLAPIPASGWGMAVAAVFVSILPWWRE